jgi:acyl carrier protein
MANQQSIIDIIYRALASLNGELDADSQVPLAPDTRLFGPEASLDSLSLVSVIVDVESAVQDELGKSISLTDDEAMSQAVSPFSSVTTLADYILKQLAKA